MVATDVMEDFSVNISQSYDMVQEDLEYISELP